MKNKKLIKNLIMIAVTVVLLSFFAIANSRFTLSMAEDDGSAGAPTAPVEDAGEVMLADELPDGDTPDGAGGDGDEDGGDGENTPDSGFVGDGEGSPIVTPEGDGNGDNGASEDEDGATEGEEPEIVGIAYIVYSIGGASQTDKYETLEAALEGAKVVADRVSEDGQYDFVPKIVLSEDITIESSITDQYPTTFEIDFNGHKVTLTSGAYINFGSSKVTLMDSAASQIVIDATTNNRRPGGILGSSGYLVTGTGEITFESGYYRISSGVIGDGFYKLKNNGAYLFSEDGNLVSHTRTIIVNGGFMMYKKPSDEESTTTLTLPESSALVDQTIIIEGNSVKGKALSNALFAVTVKQLEGSSNNPVYNFGTFEQAFNAAAEHSIAADGSVASISVTSEDILGVTITKTYELTGIGEVAPRVELDNIIFKRNSENGVFDKSMFVVQKGELILSDCEISGYIGDTEMSQNSLFVVESGATLTLVGTPENGTLITENTALKGAVAGDPCAGIYMKAGSKLKASGSICVNNNIAYTAKTETTAAKSRDCNIYMESTAKLILDGPVARSVDFFVGITVPGEIVEKGTVVGSLSEKYKSKLTGTDKVDFSAFYMDGRPTYFLNYNSEENEIFWDTDTAYLPEAGVLKLEYLIFIIGLLGFIARLLPYVRDNEAAEHYVTILAVTCLVLGTCLGFYHLRAEQLLVSRNNEIVQKLAVEQDVSNVKNTKLKEEQVEPEAEEKTGPNVPDDGREYIGIIEIPELGIILPVLDSYSDADMKTTPCVYYGNKDNNNLVIVGHNYDSQFGDFNKLLDDDRITAKISFMDGTVATYESIEIEELNPIETERMLEGQWDLTLFTCSYSGEKRITIRMNNIQ